MCPSALGLLQRRSAGLGKLLILIRARSTADADGAYDLPAHDNRDSSLKRSEIVERDHRRSALLGDDVFEILGRLAEQGCCSRLSDRDACSGGKRGIDP